MRTLLQTFRFNRDNSGYGYYEHLIHNGGVTYFNIPRRNGVVRCKLADGHVFGESEGFQLFGGTLTKRVVHGKYTLTKNYMLGLLQTDGEEIYK